MDIILIENQFLPPIVTFAHLYSAKTIRLEAQENYQKSSYRNRCHIVGANGSQALSIPLAKGKHQQSRMMEVKISYVESWQNQHQNSIKSAYGNAPFFEYYADAIFDLLQQKEPLLWNYNLAFLKGVFDLLNWEKEILFTEVYTSIDPTSKTDLRNRFLPKSHKNDAQLLKSSSYPQVFIEKHGFLPNLSILDLLFCAGPESSIILSRINATL